MDTLENVQRELEEQGVKFLVWWRGAPDPFPISELIERAEAEGLTPDDIFDGIWYARYRPEWGWSIETECYVGGARGDAFWRQHRRTAWEHLCEPEVE
jgi:hypothetical protein